MELAKIAAGKNLPHDINVVIEIPVRGEPVKYEIDKESGALFVDRFLETSMYYPCNYGFVPQTLSEDGDPVDVLVITPVPLMSGSVIRCRPIAMLNMTDEKGIDAKILAVPADKLSQSYRHIKGPEDISPSLLHTITHFFEHYKDLEEGKWVKVTGWSGAEEACREIMDSAKRFEEQKK